MRGIPGGDSLERLAQAVAERVVNLVLEAIDINAILDRVDLDALVQRIDVNKIVDEVDLDAVVDRIDLNAVIDRIDLNAVLAKVDINEVVDRLDVDALVEQTELGSLIAKGTTGVVTEVLDLLRSQGVGLDDFVARWANRLLRRDPTTMPQGPPLLVPREPTPAGAGAPASSTGPRGAR
jgi:hypothetical protein